ncbi:hypothetical protein [Arthrobacter sp. CG_A4]|nr:hypothetical protein [Arthrobacter sp. CG_A4]
MTPIAFCEIPTVSQTTPNGTYKVAYGRTDAQGLPVIEQYKKDNLTA